MSAPIFCLTMFLLALPTSIATVSDGRDLVQSQLSPVSAENGSKPLMKPRRAEDGAADADDENSLAHRSEHKHGKRQHHRGHGQHHKGHGQYPKRCDDFPMSVWEGRTYTISQKSTLHGKATYTYKIEIGVSIYQDTSDAGKFHLGNHDSYDKKREIFVGGDECASGPRQAMVNYHFGPTAKLLSATEPRPCHYQFDVQLPMADCPHPTPAPTTHYKCTCNKAGADNSESCRLSGNDNGCGKRHYWWDPLSGSLRDGEGDCDEDRDCHGSLSCGSNNCPWGDGDDCCHQPTPKPTAPTPKPTPRPTTCTCDAAGATVDSCKKSGNDAGCGGSLREGMGDCDWDSDCSGTLVCGTNNCKWKDVDFWGNGDDCCKVAPTRRRRWR